MIDVDWCMQVQGNPLYEELPDELLALLYPEGAPQCGPPAHPPTPPADPLAASTSMPPEDDWVLDNQAYQDVHGLQVNLLVPLQIL